MPIPAPILPEQLLWGHRVGVERVNLRLTSAAASDLALAIITGSKRILWVNVYKTPLSDTGVNVTLDCIISQPDLSSDVTIFSGQAVPQSGNPGTPVQLAPSPGTAGAANISQAFSILVIEMTNPDTDAMDLLFEVVYVPALTAENETITADASIAKMGFT